MYKLEIAIVMDLLTSIWDFISYNTSEIIAICAFGIAVWQGVVIRKHNKISVRPYLIFNSTFKDDNPQISVNIENVGIGPAIIKSYKMFLDSHEVDLSKKTSITDIKDKFNIMSIYGGGKTFTKKDAILAGKEEIVFKLVTKEGMDEEFDNLLAHSETDRIQIVVEYESLYGKSYTAKLQNT